MSAIAAVRIYMAELPLRIGLEHASASEAVLREVFLGLETSAGHLGLAEVRGNGAYATGADAETILRETREVIAEALLGCALAEASRRIEALPVKPPVRALADSAVHDARAREAGRPLWQVLGGREETAIPTHAQIGFCSLEAAVERARTAVRDGFRRLKVRIGRASSEADIAVVRGIRAALGEEVAVAVDANGKWDAATAGAVLRALEPSRIAWAEQPTRIGDDAALRSARNATRIPIVGDEAIKGAEDLERLSRLGAIDGVHLKLEKAGTIAELVQLARQARDLGLKVFLGQMDQGRLGSSVTTHLAASVEAEAYELWGFQNVAADVATGLEIENGCMRVPTGAGTGVAVDLGRLNLVGEFA